MTMADPGIKQLIMAELSRPVVFQEMIGDWPALSWTPESLKRHLRETTVRIRLGPLYPQKEGVLWEGDCEYINVQYSDYVDWLEGSCAENHPMMKYDRSSYWAYMDYKHIAELVSESSDLIKSINWVNFGFEGRDGKESTIWIGSEGAHTPCHYDTYGCNLVAQVYGRKRWYLFPPEQTSNMYPTRIPYEESSVFSQINVKCPDVETFAKFKETTPCIVTLQPGDVLFVPRHWWHFVECLDTSISINSWIELPEDSDERLSEAVVRTLMCGLMQLQDTPQGPPFSWLNPTEEITSHLVNLAYINQMLETLKTEKVVPVVKSPEESCGCSTWEKTDIINEQKRKHQFSDSFLTAETSAPHSQKAGKSLSSTSQCDSSLLSVSTASFSVVAADQMVLPSSEKRHKLTQASNFENQSTTNISPHCNNHSNSQSKDTEAPTNNRINMHYVEPTSFQHYLQQINSNVGNRSQEMTTNQKVSVTSEKLLKCITHPFVISQILTLLKNS